jgi:hypothetical protein
MMNRCRGIIQKIDLTRPGDDVYLVAFLNAERFTGEEAWLREAELLPA